MATTARYLIDKSALARFSNPTVGPRLRRLTDEGRVATCGIEDAGFAVLHYDSDFERIAAVTGQEQRWVVPHGSID